MAGLLTARSGRGLLLSVALMALALSTAQAWEVQLAGIRLGQHAVNLLDIYGEPDGIQTGIGEEFATGGAGAGGEMGGMGEMGEMGGEEGMMGGGEMAGMPPEEGGAGGFPGAEGEAAGAETGGAAGAGGEAAESNAYPQWAMPVWVELDEWEVEWFYRIGGVVLGFVMDRDGYIRVIAVAARECNFARTALWVPHGYVKLGDDYKRVIYRYGWPDDTINFSSTLPGEIGPGVLQWGEPSDAEPTGTLHGRPTIVAWGGVARAASHDAILRYDRNNNIAFTIHDMEVVRIHIWTNE